MNQISRIVVVLVAVLASFASIASAQEDHRVNLSVSFGQPRETQSTYNNRNQVTESGVYYRTLEFEINGDVRVSPDWRLSARISKSSISSPVDYDVDQKFGYEESPYFGANMKGRNLDITVMAEHGLPKGLILGVGVAAYTSSGEFVSDTSGLPGFPSQARSVLKFYDIGPAIRLSATRNIGSIRSIEGGDQIGHIFMAGNIEAYLPMIELIDNEFDFDRQYKDQLHTKAWGLRVEPTIGVQIKHFKVMASYHYLRINDPFAGGLAFDPSDGRSLPYSKSRKGLTFSTGFGF
jgi:hypothetical protein